MVRDFVGMRVAEVLVGIDVQRPAVGGVGIGGIGSRDAEVDSPELQAENASRA